MTLVELIREILGVLNQDVIDDDHVVYASELAERAVKMAEAIEVQQATLGGRRWAPQKVTASYMFREESTVATWRSRGVGLGAGQCTDQQTAAVSRAVRSKRPAPSGKVW